MESELEEGKTVEESQQSTVSRSIRPSSTSEPWQLHTHLDWMERAAVTRADGALCWAQCELTGRFTLPFCALFHTSRKACHSEPQNTSLWCKTAGRNHCGEDTRLGRNRLHTSHLSSATDRAIASAPCHTTCITSVFPAAPWSSCLRWISGGGLGGAAASPPPPTTTTEETRQDGAQRQHPLPTSRPRCQFAWKPLRCSE